MVSIILKGDRAIRYIPCDNSPPFLHIMSSSDLSPVSLYETMVWLSRTVRQTYPSWQPDAMLSVTDMFSSYEKHTCSLLTKIEHLKRTDDRHPVNLMETRYKRLFEKVYFHEIPLHVRNQCSLSIETEADVKADRTIYVPSPRGIWNEPELQQYYCKIILNPAVAMAKTVLLSKECPVGYISSTA
jgi:hypothetical protein